jgi:hypothetical protein
LWKLSREKPEPASFPDLVLISKEKPGSETRLFAYLA